MTSPDSSAASRGLSWYQNYSSRVHESRSISTTRKGHIIIGRVYVAEEQLRLSEFSQPWRKSDSFSFASMPSAVFVSPDRTLSSDLNKLVLLSCQPCAAIRTVFFFQMNMSMSKRRTKAEAVLIDLHCVVFYWRHRCDSLIALLLWDPNPVVRRLSNNTARDDIGKSTRTLCLEN